MTERASLNEVLEFCNKVREAGGANPLDALMPSIPTDPNSCLIANNLNFNCRVDASLKKDEFDLETLKDQGYNSHLNAWCMSVRDIEVGKKIADNLGLKYSIRVKGYEGIPECVIILPAKIGKVAFDFDSYWESLEYEYMGHNDYYIYNYETDNEFKPYIDLVNNQKIVSSDEFEQIQDEYEDSHDNEY